MRRFFRSKIYIAFREIRSWLLGKNSADVENPVIETGGEEYHGIDIPQGMNVFRGRDLRVLEIVGEGDMGVVRRVHIRSSNVPSLVGTTAVIKIVKAEIEEDKLEAVRECSVLMKLVHLRNVVTPYGLYIEQDDVGIVMERLQGPILSDFVRQPVLGPFAVFSIMQQLFYALSRMHALNVAHMDVKPSNIILERPSSDLSDVGTVKLFDLGIANDGGNSESVFDQTWNECAGSLGYQAPEVFEGEVYNSASADVWGAGVVWAELSIGNRLFEGENVDDYLDDVDSKVSTMDMLLGTAYSSMEEVRHVLSCCLEYDPAKRPSAEYVSEFLRGVVASL